MNAISEIQPEIESEIVDAVFPTKRLFAAICADVSRKTGVSVEHILSERRDGQTARARQLVMWQASRNGIGVASIGRLIGRDHSSVISGIRRIETILERAKQCRP